MTQIGSSMEINKRIRGCPAISGQPLPIASAQYSLGTLPACMVNGVLPFQDDLRNGNEGIALLKQIFNNTRQCFGSVFRSIVEQHNGTRLDFARHALCYFTRFQIFPIQAVHIPLNGLHSNRTSGLLYYLFSTFYNVPFNAFQQEIVTDTKKRVFFFIHGVRGFCML